MSSIVLVAPYVPPPPPGIKFTGLVITWTGWDGSEWTLTDDTGGVFLTAEGVEGLDFAPADRFTTASPLVAGSRYRGSRTLERPIVLPIQVFSDSSAGWLAIQRAFFRSLHRDRVGTLSVSLESGEVRTIEARLVTPGGKAHGRDPMALGWSDHEVHLVAEDPYWRGEEIVEPFTAGTPAEFFPEDGGPEFHIAGTANFSTATITNPGGVDAWPVVTVRDATTAFSVGIGGSTVGSTYDLADGDVMVIDYDPRRQSVTVNGVRVRGILSPHDFAAIPAESTTSLDISLTGTGSVEVALVPLFERVW